ncbi:MAG: glutaredoxin family protein [Oscillatoriophycideae cyanobacterium NC_groundwater_1537_Pr4_S-0.65um_50_18]|nr:glutaredoxin family protein [Oscillatoriophycideae cyanobacterium NC_groundwater_1537_Pr4_S-0.65um_50_18]
MHLILYSKPGCHLCEGLQSKLKQVQNPPIELEIRDITTREDWFQAYQYEIPVLYLVPAMSMQSDAQTEKPHTPLIPLPRISARASVRQIEQVLQKSLVETSKNEAK